MTKRAIYQGMRNDLRTNLDLISSHYAVITATQEHKDLVRSFIAAARRSARAEDLGGGHFPGIWKCILGPRLRGNDNTV